MLTITDNGKGIRRRDLLAIGGLGIGGLSLASLFAARAGAQESRDPVTGKSVIFLFQQGGPSQFETFDPKPDAPDGIRTVTGCTETSVPGIIFGDTMSQLARIAHKLTIVRSFQTNNAGHNIRPIVGPETKDASIGAYYTQVAGPTRAGTGMPNNVVLFNNAVADDVTKGKARGNLAATGPFGAIHAAFIPGAGGQLQKDMKLNIAPDAFEDRQRLLSQLGELNRHFETSEQLQDLDKIQKQAYQVLLSGTVGNALDLTREDPKTIARYDTSGYAAKDDWSKVNRGKRGYYTGHAKSLGKLLLLARRLCEAGCGFITIHAGYEGVWDMHADGNNLNMTDGMEAVGRSFDHAVTAFIEDVEARGLQDRILLVCTGEMGRTPKINKKGGRDHWARLAPLLLYGGGVKPGVIGRSTPDGGQPATAPQTSQNLLATILHTVLDVGLLRITGDAPQVVQLSEPGPIEGLY
jgi:hypothetical protein